MGRVSLEIAGRNHVIACRDDEEAHLRALSQRLRKHAPAAIRASGHGPAERTLLIIALMLADELAEKERQAQPSLPTDLFERLAERLESVASALEDDGEPS